MSGGRPAIYPGNRSPISTWKLRAAENLLGGQEVSGHGFSRAGSATRRTWASAPAAPSSQAPDTPLFPSVHSIHYFKNLADIFPHPLRANNFRQSRFFK